MDKKSNCCDALMTDIDDDGIGICSECKEWAWSYEEEPEDDFEEDVNYEAAKDLDEDRLRGIRARCYR